jgi:hypothetical protein
MQLAIFLQREFIAAHGFELWLALEALAGGNIAFADRKVHGGIKRAHLELNGGIADLGAVSASPVLAPPSRILFPAIRPDEVNLCVAHIAIKRPKQDIFEVFDPRGGNLACVSATLLHGDIFLRHFPERAIEHGMVMFEQNADFSIFIDGQLAGGSQIGRT